MENREGFKKVVSFARKCFKQTRPKPLELRRIKAERVKQFGSPLVMLELKPIVQYIVCAYYYKQLRIFFFSTLGDSLGGKNYDAPLDDIKSEIAKKSNLIRKFERKRRS